MKMQVSALVDGELDDAAAKSAIGALTCSGDLRGEWCTYHRIGSALRGEPDSQLDVVSRVMAALDDEPTVLAPKPKTAAKNWRDLPGLRPVMALAASAAGVAVVAWVALSVDGVVPSTGSASLASAKPPVLAAPASAVVLAKNQPKATPRMQEYLVAHQAYAPGGDIVGGVRNIRTVSVSGEGR